MSDLTMVLMLFIGINCGFQIGVTYANYRWRKRCRRIGPCDALMPEE